MVKKNLAIGLSVVMAASMLGMRRKRSGAGDDSGGSSRDSADRSCKDRGGYGSCRGKSGENVTITYISSTILESPEETSKRSA